MENSKIVESRLKGLIQEFKLLDEFTVKQAEKVKEYKSFIDKCREDKSPYKEIKDELQKHIEAQRNFTVLKDDVFALASRVVECNKIIELTHQGDEMKLSEDDVEVLNACKSFTSPTYIAVDGKIDILASEYRDFLASLIKEMDGDENAVQKDYEQMLIM